ncbi:hypothetical protein EUTSA_v10000416mg [Eutrema salsugineum]|uniref:Uncharacterized protein n=1 Tax=Eutrema salsugineum TaxID=72664 RepID=V4L7I2_EUTSA|nr:hypothetical protein EUTSA_v10000416mg [Eutrema salsugineum]
MRTKRVEEEEEEEKEKENERMNNIKEAARKNGRYYRVMRVMVNLRISQYPESEKG